MHNVTAVPTKSGVVFYPIGNTPAVDFLNQYSVGLEDETKEILSLACGDARSILYTIWCDSRPGKGKINFTCCDLEPAVLARNILLFSLIIDHAAAYNSSIPEETSKITSIWNIYYHFFLSREDLDLVQKQSQKLLNCSETPDKWALSPYSAINVVSFQTAAELRKIWTRYSEVRTDLAQTQYDTSRRAEIRKTYNRLYAAGRISNTFYAGPHWQEGLATYNDGLKGYWDKGVVGGNAADVKALGNKNKGYSNPLIMVSSFSESFLLHDTSDPVTGFHVASVFDGDYSEKSRAKNLGKLVAIVKAQFREWSKAFAEYYQSESVQVNFFYGDAITFCHELAARIPNSTHSAKITRLFASQWSSKLLVLDGEGGKKLPLYFDVIDTSNLVDWIGLLNILLPMSQILKRKSTSVLWTEVFRLCAEEPENDLYENLLMNVDLACLLIGLAPLGHLFGYGFDNTLGEDIIHLKDRNRYRMRIPWKIILDHETKFEVIQNPHNLRVGFDAEELANIFFKIYLDMFAQEDLSKSTREHKNKPPMNSKLFSRFSRIHYASLIQHSLARIDVDQESFFNKLSAKIEDDESLHIGGECVPDLMLQLQLSGTLASSFMYHTHPPSTPRFKCVTLVVPRKKLALFKRLGGTPLIHLRITENGDNFLLFSLDCFFGSAKQNPDGSWGEVIEDPQGWAGSSDLIITSPAPADTFCFDEDWACSLQITLSILALDYINELGPEATVYRTSTKQAKKRLFVSDLPPRCPTNLHPFDLQNPPFHPTLPGNQAVTFNASLKTGSLVLQAKYTIAKDSEEAIALGSAAFVSLTDFSPCSILLKIGSKNSRRIIFPYPIDSAKAKTKIARKSLWIEINVPAAAAHVEGGYDINPFPVVIEAGHQPSSWSLPRVNLDQQPIISFKGWEDRLGDILHQYTSKRECEIIDRGAHPFDFRSTLASYKKTVQGFFEDIAENPNTRIFVLTGTKSSVQVVFDFLFIVNAIRHARETGGMLIDAWILPITEENRDEFYHAVPITPGAASVFQSPMEETKLWKQLMPAAVESCRRNWKHKDSCEYLSKGCVPLSTDDWESPICRCGEGMDVDALPNQKLSRTFKTRLTRVAIPMLAAVPYVEATGNLMPR